VFWGLGLFCIIKTGQRTEGGEVKSKKGKGKSEKTGDGFGVGRDCRWIGILGSRGWEFGLLGVMMILAS